VSSFRQGVGLPHVLSNKDRDGGREMALEPGSAVAAVELRKGELVVIAKSGEEPRGGIAETFAGVTAPGGGAACAIGTGELSFAPLRAPAEFTPAELGLKNFFPTASGLVRQAQPGEMENFVDENAIEVVAIAKNLGVEQNEAARDGGRGKMRAEGAAKLDADGPAGEWR